MLLAVAGRTPRIAHARRRSRRRRTSGPRRTTPACRPHADRRAPPAAPDADPALPARPASRAPDNRPAALVGQFDGRPDTRPRTAADRNRTAAARRRPIRPPSRSTRDELAGADRRRRPPRRPIASRGVERAHHPLAADDDRQLGQRDGRRRDTGTVSSVVAPRSSTADQHPIVQRRLGGPAAAVDVDGVLVGQPPRRAAGQRRRPQPGGPAGRVDAGEFDAEVEDWCAGDGQQCRRSAGRRTSGPTPVGIGLGCPGFRQSTTAISSVSSSMPVVRTYSSRPSPVNAGSRGAGRFVGQLHRLPRFVTRGSTREVEHEDLLRLVD